MKHLPWAKPWLLEFIINEQDKPPRVPRMLYVLQAAERPCSDNDGSCAKLVCDGDLSITAIFTAQALKVAEADEMSEENGLASLEDWDQSQILVKKYTLSILMAKEKNKCQFLLEVDDFCLWCLTAGFKPPILPLSCMDMARVKYRAYTLWLADRKKQIQAVQEEVPKPSHHFYKSVSLTKPLSEIKEPSPTQGQVRIVRVHSIDASNNMSQKVSEDDPRYGNEQPATSHQVSTVSGCFVFSELTKTKMDCTNPGTSTLVGSNKQIPEQTTRVATVGTADSVRPDTELGAEPVLKTHNNNDVKVTQVKQPEQGMSSTGQTNTADNDCGSGIEPTLGQSPVNKQCSAVNWDGQSSVQDQSLARFVREQLEPDCKEKGATSVTQEEQDGGGQAFSLLHVSTLEDVCSVGESSTESLRLSMDEGSDMEQTSAMKTGKQSKQIIVSAEEDHDLSASQIKDVCLEKASSTELCNKRLLSAANTEHSSNQVGFRILQPEQNEFQQCAEDRERNCQRSVDPPSSSVGTSSIKDNELEARTISIQVGRSLMMDGLEPESRAEGKIDSAAVEISNRKRTATDLVQSSQPEVSGFEFECWTCQSDGGQVSDEQMDDFDRDLLSCANSLQTSADQVQSPSEYRKRKNLKLPNQSTDGVAVHSTQVDETHLTLPDLQLSPVMADCPVMTRVDSEDELMMDERLQGAHQVEQSSSGSCVASGEKSSRDFLHSESDREQLEKSGEDVMVSADCTKSLSNVKEIIIVSSGHDSTDDEAVASSSDGVKSTKDKQCVGQCLEKGRLQESTDEVIEDKEVERKGRSGADTDHKNKYGRRVLRQIADTHNNQRKKANEMFVDETRSRTKSTTKRKPKVKISKSLELHETFPKMTKISADKNALKCKRRRRLYNVNSILEASSPEMVEDSSCTPQEPAKCRTDSRKKKATESYLTEDVLESPAFRRRQRQGVVRECALAAAVRLKLFKMGHSVSRSAANRDDSPLPGTVSVIGRSLRLGMKQTIPSGLCVKPVRHKQARVRRPKRVDGDRQEVAYTGRCPNEPTASCNQPTETNLPGTDLDKPVPTDGTLAPESVQLMSAMPVILSTRNSQRVEQMDTSLQVLLEAEQMVVDGKSSLHKAKFCPELRRLTRSYMKSLLDQGTQ